MRSVSTNAGLQRRGYSLVIVLLAVVILLAIGGGLLSLGLQGRVLAIRSGQELAARCAADAGLTKAIFEMNEKLKVRPYNDSPLPQGVDEPLPNCDATYSYTVTGDLDTGYAVESIGRCSYATRKINATLRLRGLFDWGIVVKQTLILMADTLVDGYHSSKPGTDVWVQIGTISEDVRDIILKTGVHVDGDVLYGIDYDFIDVYPPPLPTVEKEIRAKGTTVTIRPEDNGAYPGINLQQQLMPTGPNSTAVVPGTLEIEGDVTLYITGDVWLGHSCEITIKPNSSLTMYVDGNFITGNDSGVNNLTQIPKNFLLYGTGVDQKFELKAKEDWYGAVYAPNADIIIKAKGDTYGAFVARNFENKNSGRTWYDAALSEVTLEDPVRFAIKRWSEE